jgi:hypothetical protein
MSIAIIPEQDVATVQPPPSASGMSLYGSRDSYRMALDAAAKLSASKIVPDSFKDDPGACLIAIDTASRLDIPLLMVLQNLYVVKGKPSWSGSFVIARLNSCGRFAPLDFVMEGEGDTLSCYVTTTRRSDGRRLNGTKITMAMVKTEGWGPKWKTMPEQMMCYRAAAYFGRVHAPDVILGMQTVEEVEDVVADAWQGDKRPTVTAEIVDPHRDDFEAVLAAEQWTPKQRASLRNRYAAADEPGRAKLVTDATAQLVQEPTDDA